MMIRLALIFFGGAFALGGLKYISAKTNEAEAKAEAVNMLKHELNRLDAARRNPAAFDTTAEQALIDMERIHKLLKA